jgi:hypothetical protein
MGIQQISQSMQTLVLQGLERIFSFVGQVVARYYANAITANTVPESVYGMASFVGHFSFVGRQSLARAIRESRRSRLLILSYTYTFSG